MNNPLISVIIHGELYLYTTDQALEYETYRQIKAIAEDKGLYRGNPTCVNPSVLAYEFVQNVQAQTGVGLKAVDTWPLVKLNINEG
ncbi:MAG: hypothetical protein Q4C55_08955 [Eubacterium sp.]|nr:hypothetical protein [Eubacterium sp.]